VLPHRSVLAEIALQFLPRRELVATAGLGHLLRTSLTARSHLERLVSAAGASLPRGLQYRNEGYDETAPGRPDIVGSVGGSTHLIVEGKFWAELTEAQPVDYLRWLVPGGLLLFVAPARRKDLLWGELKRRCQDAGLPPCGDQRTQRLDYCKTGDSHYVAVASWTDLLTDIRDALDAEDEGHLKGDLDQLLDLCRLEDEEAFLPLTPLDLAGPTPLRVLQLMALVEKVNQKGLETGLLQPSKMKLGQSLGRFGRYVSTSRLQLWLGVDLHRWHAHGLIPLWLEIAVEPGEVFRDLDGEIPPRVVYDGFAGRPVVGLPLALHVEEAEVINDAMRQIAEILERVKSCRPTVELPEALDSSLADMPAADEPGGADATPATTQ